MLFHLSLLWLGAYSSSPSHWAAGEQCPVAFCCPLLSPPWARLRRHREPPPADSDTGSLVCQELFPLCLNQESTVPSSPRTQLLSHFNWSLGIQAGPPPKDVTKNQDPGYPSRSRYNTGGCRSQEGSWRLESRVSLGIVVGMFPPPLPPQMQKGSQWSPHFHPLRQWREKLQGDHLGAGK